MKLQDVIFCISIGLCGGTLETITYDLGKDFFVPHHAYMTLNNGIWWFLFPQIGAHRMIEGLSCNRLFTLVSF